MKTIQIDIKSITKATFSNADGLSLKTAISNALVDGNSVVLSFSNIDSVSSSFLNSSLGDIIDNFGFDVLKNRIKITNYTSHLATIINKYISDLKFHELA